MLLSALQSSQPRASLLASPHHGGSWKASLTADNFLTGHTAARPSRPAPSLGARSTPVQIKQLLITCCVKPPCRLVDSTESNAVCPPRPPPFCGARCTIHPRIRQGRSRPQQMPPFCRVSRCKAPAVSARSATCTQSPADLLVQVRRQIEFHSECCGVARTAQSQWPLPPPLSSCA